MPVNWRDIPDDELLNYQEAATGQTARYHRIMMQKSIVAIDLLKSSVLTLNETIQGIHKAMDDHIERLSNAWKQAQEAQDKKSKRIYWLTWVIAVAAVFYTWVSIKSTLAIIEGTDIQRQAYNLQEAEFKASHPVPFGNGHAK